MNRKRELDLVSDMLWKLLWFCGNMVHAYHSKRKGLRYHIAKRIQARLERHFGLD